MMNRYGEPILVLDLVRKREKKPRETLIGTALGRQVRYLNTMLPPERRLQYWALDFKAVVRGCNGSGHMRGPQFFLICFLFVCVFSLFFFGCGWRACTQKRDCGSDCLIPALRDAAQWVLANNGFFCNAPRVRPNSQVRVYVCCWYVCCWYVCAHACVA